MFYRDMKKIKQLSQRVSLENEGKLDRESTFEQILISRNFSDEMVGDGRERREIPGK